MPDESPPVKRMPASAVSGGVSGGPSEGSPSERRHRHFIAGEFRDSVGGATRPFAGPFGGAVAEVAVADPHDLTAAVDAAEVAFERFVPPSQREGWLMEAARILAEHEDRLVDDLIDEIGSPIGKARREVATSIGVLRAASAAARRMTGWTLPTDHPGRSSFAVREPLGVVAAISPFNVPLIKMIKQSALALATGNTVVALPSMAAPGVACRVADIYAAAGVPAGRFNVVLGDGRTIGDGLTGDPRVASIQFTGSTATGRRIAGIAAKRGAMVTLEMGGKNPLIVLPDADQSAACGAAVAGGFLYAGQICMASSRLLVHRSIADDFIARLAAAAEKHRTLGTRAAELRQEGTLVGPLIDRTSVDRVVALLDDAKSAGATVIAGGGREGQRLEPTLIESVAPESRIAREETFAPVITIERFGDLDEAIERANATTFGLCAAIYTDSESAAERFTRRCRAGMVHVNGPTIQEEAHVPFGGNGASGFGREGAIAGIESLTRWKWITRGPAG